MADPAIGRVVSVSVGRPRHVNGHGRTVTTAISKHPLEGRHRVAGVDVDRDDQADRRVHGGPTKGIYASAVADYTWWLLIGAGRWGKGRQGVVLSRLGSPANTEKQ